ncbi:MAG: ferritin-like domain-containing protein [Pseudomonadota bacterium]
MPPPASYLDLALSVLNSGAPDSKCEAARTAGEMVQSASVSFEPQASEFPDRPARPKNPKLVSPRLLKKRSLGTQSGRAALLHAVAHIELNAIDLAFDMAGRFAGEISEMGLNTDQFIADWFNVGQEEAFHFSMINQRLGELGSGYGDLDAHDGLWQAAMDTSDSVLARLAIAPLVLEARGLDVTPGMISRLETVGDKISADLLRVIYRDEVGHVEVGTKWFLLICREKDLDPGTTFQDLVAKRFRSGLKGPFNVEARERAGMPGIFYGSDAQFSSN